MFYGRDLSAHLHRLLLEQDSVERRIDKGCETWSHLVTVSLQTVAKLVLDEVHKGIIV